jgi:hypothetical protein
MTTIENFLYKKDLIAESWFAGINTLYGKSMPIDPEASSKLSDETLDWIRKPSKFLVAELANIDTPEKKDYESELNALNKIQQINTWFFLRKKMYF